MLEEIPPSLSVTAPVPDQARALVARSIQDLSMVESIAAIDSPQARLIVAHELIEVTGRANQLEALRKDITRPMDDAKKKVLRLFAPALERYATARAGLKRAILAWDQAQERKRRDEETRLRDLARKERAKLQQAANKAAAKGQDDMADALQQRADTLPMPVVPPDAAPKTAGVTTREHWTFRITDAAAIPREYLVPDEPTIRAVVRALKGATNIPGVEAYAEQIIAAGRR
jgi:hypothetical protein